MLISNYDGTPPVNELVTLCFVTILFSDAKILLPRSSNGEGAGPFSAPLHVQIPSKVMFHRYRQHSFVL
jgi:hypothetical protein